MLIIHEKEHVYNLTYNVPQQPLAPMNVYFNQSLIAITMILLYELTKITISNQSYKSYRKYKSEKGHTRTSEYIRGEIRCNGGVSTPCCVGIVKRGIVTRMNQLSKK
jgi:hypothetical protein